MSSRLIINEWNIFPILGGDDKWLKIWTRSSNELFLFHLDPRINEYEPEVQDIIHL